MMIVVCPAKSKPVLPRLLHSSGAIPALPECALLGEDRVAGEIAAHKINEAVDQFMGVPPAFNVI